MLTVKSLLVPGFSPRSSIDEMRKIWKGDEYLQTCLIKKDITAPLSVDDSVWPVDDVAIYENSALQCEEGIAFYLDLNICSLDADHDLTDIAANTKVNLVAYCVDETVLRRLLGQHFEQFENEISKVTDLIGPRKEFLGFDVCDSIGISSVTNCGLNEDRDVVSIYKNALNEWGLFADYQVAEEYADLSSQKIKQHGSFYPIGLMKLT